MPPGHADHPRGLVVGSDAESSTGTGGSGTETRKEASQRSNDGLSRSPCRKPGAQAQTPPIREPENQRTQPNPTQPDSLLHQVLDRRLDLGLVVGRVDTLAGDDAELLQARTLALGDGRLDALNRLADIQAVQVDGAVRLGLVVLCGRVSVGA